MSTRGAVGFVVDGKLKLAYNHSDSYPSGLGQDVVDFLITLFNGPDFVMQESYALNMEALKEKVRALKIAKGKPTEADKKHYAPHADLGVSNQSLDDWYCLLRNFQGVDGLKAIVGGILKHTDDANTFPENSLFCEWAYVIDLDGKALEVYQGFQSKPHAKGRFASAKPKKEDGGYYGCKLVKKIPFKKVNPTCLGRLTKD